MEWNVLQKHLNVPLHFFAFKFKLKIRKTKKKKKKCIRSSLYSVRLAIVRVTGQQWPFHSIEQHRTCTVDTIRCPLHSE